MLGDDTVRTFGEASIFLLHVVDFEQQIVYDLLGDLRDLVVLGIGDDPDASYPFHDGWCGRPRCGFIATCESSQGFVCLLEESVRHCCRATC